MKYAPEPTDDQLASLGDAIAPGGSVRFGHRILGGLGCTMDVLRVEERGGHQLKVVLRRRTAWPGDDAVLDALTEFKVLGHLRRHDISVPDPVWFDDKGVFEEPAMVIEHIDGTPLLAPDDPLDYAEQYARALAGLNDVPVSSELAGLLPDFNAHEARLMAADGPPDRVSGHPLGHELWEAQQASLARTPLAAPALVHSDYWPGNTLWKDQRLVAIVDLEEVGTGDPVADVGSGVINLRYEEWGEPAAERFVDVYQTETGRFLETLRYWKLRELRKPMPDIARWLPSFQAMSSRTEITADELRDIHTNLLREVLDER